MTINDVRSIMGPGLYINEYISQELTQKYYKNSTRGYMCMNRDIANNPLYKIRLESGEEVLYYGESRYDYSTNGVKETNTYYYFAIIVFFKNGIIDTVVDHNGNVLFSF